MSRAKKLCEEINAVVDEYGHAYVAYNAPSGIKVVPEFTCRDSILMTTCEEASEEMILDSILMRWEFESASSEPHRIPNYLWAIRERLWSDYNVD